MKRYNTKSIFYDQNKAIGIKMSGLGSRIYCVFIDKNLSDLFAELKCYRPFTIRAG
jgi:hypothetical protein